MPKKKKREKNKRLGNAQEAPRHKKTCKRTRHNKQTHTHTHTHGKVTENAKKKRRKKRLEAELFLGPFPPRRREAPRCESRGHGTAVVDRPPPVRDRPPFGVVAPAGGTTIRFALAWKYYTSYCGATRPAGLRLKLKRGCSPIRTPLQRREPAARCATSRSGTPPSA